MIHHCFEATIFDEWWDSYYATLINRRSLKFIDSLTNSILHIHMFNKNYIFFLMKINKSNMRMKYMFRSNLLTTTWGILMTISSANYQTLTLVQILKTFYNTGLGLLMQKSSLSWIAQKDWYNSEGQCNSWRHDWIINCLASAARA